MESHLPVLSCCPGILILTFIQGSRREKDKKVNKDRKEEGKS
jgi:hypothetical protein